jgi:hypothetical protein
MIGKSVKGSSAGGLVAYLAGPGKANEHENPRLVVGSFDVELLMSDVGRDLTSEKVRIGLARALNSPAKRFGKEATLNVWHVPISCPPGEQPTLDEWRLAAFSMVEKLSVDEGYRWALVKHGANRDGLDHAHLVIQRTHTETGKLVSVAYDFKRVNAAAELTARELGLTELAEQQHFLPKSLQRTDLEPREMTGRVERIHLKINEALEHSDGTTADFEVQLTARGIKARAVSHGDRGGFAFAEVDRADVWLTGKQARWTPEVLGAAVIERRQEVTAEKVAQDLEQQKLGVGDVSPAAASGVAQQSVALDLARIEELRAVNAAAADAYKQAKSTVAQLDQQLDDAEDQAYELQSTAREVEDEWTAARSTAMMVDQARVQQARELTEWREQLVRLERQVALLTAKRPEGLRRREYKREVEQATEQLDARRQQHYRAERSFANSTEWRPNSPIYGVEDPSQLIELADTAAAAAAERQEQAQAATAQARGARRQVEQLTQIRKTARQAAARTWGEWVQASRELAIEEYRQEPTAENLAEAARVEVLTRPAWAQRDVAGTGKRADALRKELAAARISAGIIDPDAPSAAILTDELRHRITQHHDELAKQPSHEPPRARTHTNDQGQDGGIDR